MNVFSRITKLALVGCTLLAVTAMSVQAQSKAVTAKVRSVRGTAKYSDNGSWQNLRVNDVLNAGTVIQTESDSTVDLFVNNSVIRITPETTFGLDKMQALETGADTVTETQLYLKSGRILGNVKKLAGASKYQIKTPNGVTGIRGTALEMSYLPGPLGMRLTVRCINGKLVGSAANSQGAIKTAVINEGETWSPDEDVTVIPQEVLVLLRGEVPSFTDGGVIPPTTVPQPNPVIIYEEPTIGPSPSTP